LKSQCYELVLTHYSYKLSGPIGKSATIGLVVLQTDESIEHDFRRIFSDRDIALYVTRVPSGTEVSGETLASMSDNLPAAASLLPRSLEFDVVGYGCTSGSAVIGTDKIAQLVKSTCKTKHVTDPLSSLVEMCEARGVKNLGLLSPYVASVSQTLRGVLDARGIATPAFGSFDEAEEAKVARISQASIRYAAIEIGRSRLVDGVFLSCTNLRTLDVIPEIEAELGKPVFSSNQVLAWNMARLAGIETGPR
jgi:maleate isomerase